MADLYYQQTYKCSNCHTISKHYLWVSNIKTETHECPQVDCKHPLGAQQLHHDEINDAPSVGKMTKGQIRIDRQKRSHNDFVKNVYPTLSRKDKQHFKKKGADK